MRSESSSGALPTVLDDTRTDGDGDAAHGAEPGENASLIAIVRARLIDFRSLNVPLRVAVAFTIVAAVVCAAIIVLRDVPQPQLTIDLGSSSPAAPIPTAAFIVAFTLWVVAWSLALTGAIHGHWALRLLVLAAFVYVMIESVVLDPVVLAIASPLALILVWAGVITVLDWSARRRRRATSRRLPLVTLGIVLVCLLIHYGVFLGLTLLFEPTGDTFKSLITQEFAAFGFVLVPVLCVSGTDLAEWAEAASGQLIAWLDRPRIPWLLGGGTALLALVILVVGLARRVDFAPWNLASVVDFGLLVVICALVTLLFLGIARLGRISSWSRARIPAGALIVAALAITAFTTGVAYVDDFRISLTPLPNTPQVTYAVYQHPAAGFSPVFSIAYPLGWQHDGTEPKTASDLLTVFFSDAASPGTPTLQAVAIPAIGTGGATAPQVAHVTVAASCQMQACPVTYTALPPLGPWDTERIVAHDQDANGHPVEIDGWVWDRTVGNTIWVLYGSSQPAGVHAAQPIFTTMVESWRPNLSAQEPSAPSSVAAWIPDPDSALSFGVVPLLVALFVGLPLLLRGRWRPGALAAVGLFLVVFGVREGMFYLTHTLAHFGVPTSHVLFSLPGGWGMTLDTLPVLNMPLLQVLAALATLGTLAWLLVRRRIGRARSTVAALLMLNGGLLGIALLDMLFTATDTIAARFTAAQGALLVLAFLWDLLTSGEQVTNREGRRSPRAARVLLYLGYSMLSFSQVLFLTALAVPGAALDNGNWASIGLELLGVPLLLTVVLIRLVRPRNTWETTYMPNSGLSATVERAGAGFPPSGA